MSGQKVDPSPFGWNRCQESATKEIGIEEDKAEKLFYKSKWPTQFNNLEDISEESASLAIARIDHFIATEGKE